MAITYLGRIVNPSVVTVSGHGDVATDNADGFRNDTAASGNVKVDVINADGTVTTHTFANVPSGYIVPVQISRVYETGTTLATVELIGLR